MKQIKDLHKKSPLPPHILSVLKQLEIQHSVKFIYCAQIGSKAKGYADPSSDNDLQLVHIPVNPIFSYLIDESTDVIKFKDDKIKIDLVSFDLRKTINHLKKCNNEKLHCLLSQPSLIPTSFDISEFMFLYDQRIALPTYWGIFISNLKQIDFNRGYTLKKLTKNCLKAGYSLLQFYEVTQSRYLPTINIEELIEKYTNEYPDLVQLLKLSLEAKRSGESLTGSQIEEFDFILNCHLPIKPYNFGNFNQLENDVKRANTKLVRLIQELDGDF